MTPSQHETDAVIIGAGPVGLFSVFECGMVKIRTHVVDALDCVGGQCAALYPEKPIYDIPALPEVSGQDLVDRLCEQNKPFNPVYHLDQQVTELTKTLNGWRVTTSAGTQIDCKAVIIAAGVGAFGPNRPPLDGLERFEGKSVFYFVKRREAFRDQKVVIAGGGDSAVDWAIALADIAARIYVVHRRDKFRAAPESVARMHALVEEGKVEMVVPYQLHGLDGTNGRLEKVTVATLKGEVKALEADVLLPFFGLATKLGPIAEWGLNMDRNHIAVDPATAMTSAEGVFAVGDVSQYPGKLKLILQGFSEAAVAAHSAFNVVHPGEALHFEYSTTSGVHGF